MHSFLQDFKPSTNTAMRVNAIKNSSSDLRKLAKASGWKILASFANKLDNVNSHNDFNLAMGLWANKQFFWSKAQTACVEKALASVPHFKTYEELEWEHECDEYDRLRKGE
jgi:hypothetical protein